MDWKEDSRIERLNSCEPKKNVLYVMSRDQRIYQNHSIELSYRISYKLKSQFFIGIEFAKLKMNKIQEKFVVEGLNEVFEECGKYNLSISNITDLKDFIKTNNIGTVILDFCPLRESLERREEIKKICQNICLIVCDSHNIVPCRCLEKYKRTSKAVKHDLYAQWARFLKEYEKLKPHKYNKINEAHNPFEVIKAPLIHKGYKPMFRGGYSEGMKTLDVFFKNKFQHYCQSRNNPEVDVLSNLSPYLHTGQISPLEVILITNEKYGKEGSSNYINFVDEFFIWREIAEHFVFHEPNYDNIQGALPWARETLMSHATDARTKTYTQKKLEDANTEDDLWNAAQREMMISGKMHGYVRMYWAKRLLGWFNDPSEALKVGIDLNDKYSMDGNDPNGYLGVMWSICGSMDRAFGERKIFGKIRPMKSFKSPSYIQKWTKNSKI